MQAQGVRNKRDDLLFLAFAFASSLLTLFFFALASASNVNKPELSVPARTDSSTPPRGTSLRPYLESLRGWSIDIFQDVTFRWCKWLHHLA